MERYELESLPLYRAFVRGGHETIRKREAIDAINVFPVADGDTGTNLAMTMSSLINNSRPAATAGETMQSMAEAALVGARGNSGIIFAQYLAGLSEFLGETTSVSGELFAAAARHAERRAREAVLVPVEGTILTLMRDWARLLDEHRHLGEFGRIFSTSLPGAKRSLDNTPRLLPLLREEGVVDAGAEGFYHFLSGMTSYLLSGDEEEDLSPPPDLPAAAERHEGLHPRLRYCTEFLVGGSGLDLEAIKRGLAPLGDCLIVASGADKVRIHLHSDDPALVRRFMSRQGPIIEQKVDDMLREYETVHARSYPIALVTDSICDLPQSLLDRYQIHVVPLTILVGGEQQLDRLTVTNREVYEAMEGQGPYPSTTQPSPALFRRLYAFLSAHYESVIAIHVSSKLSGTFATSRIEADRLQGKRISVIDSRQDSGSQALVVLRAAELIAEGRSHDEVLRAIGECLPKARILVSVPTLRYMVRGGRVSPLKGMLAALFNLKPIVSLDESGAAVLYGKAFSRRRNERKLLSLAGAFIGRGRLRCYAIVHADNPEAARRFAAAAETALGQPPLFLQEISPIIALNAGRKALALVIITE